MRSASIVTRRLTTGCMTVCATPAYLEKHGTPTRPEHLLEHPCLSLPSEYWGDERVFTGPDGEVRVRPSNVIVANNTEMLRQFALLGMGIAILSTSSGVVTGRQAQEKGVGGEVLCYVW